MSNQLPDDIFEEVARRVASIIEPLHNLEALELPQVFKATSEDFILREIGPVTVLHLCEDEDAKVATLRIEDIIIATPARGAGLGTRLIIAIRDLCQERSLDLNLSASPMSDHGTPEREVEFEQLMRLYRRLGFVDEFGQPDGNLILRGESPSPGPG